MAEALAYLHSVEQIVHVNVSPQSIVVTKRGMWKLAGFTFAVSQQTVGLPYDTSYYSNDNNNNCGHAHKTSPCAPLQGAATGRI